MKSRKRNCGSMTYSPSVKAREGLAGLFAAGPSPLSSLSSLRNPRSSWHGSAYLGRDCSPISRVLAFPPISASPHERIGEDSEDSLLDSTCRLRFAEMIEHHGA